MRPKQFYIAAIIMFLLALSFPVQVVFLYGHHWSEWATIFSKITWLNWLVAVSFVVCGYLYFNASRLLIVAAPVIVILSIVNNYVVGKFAGDYSLAQTNFASLGVALLFTPLLMPSSQIILRDPKRRWWRRSKRFNKRVSATINPYVGEMLQAHTYDISKTGAFLSVDINSEDVPKVGDVIRVSLNVNSMKKIRCEAQVVRVTEANGRYPDGIGLKFLEIKKSHQKSFQQFVNSNDYLH